MRLNAVYAAFLFTLFPSSTSISSIGDNALTTRAPADPKSVIIQMFGWTWDSIATECTDFIGPAGYGFVQGGILPFHFVAWDDTDACGVLWQWAPHRNTSLAPNGGRNINPFPIFWRPSEAIVLNSKSQFPTILIIAICVIDVRTIRSMISTCHTAGIKVIVGQHPYSLLKNIGEQIKIMAG